MIQSIKLKWAEHIAGIFQKVKVLSKMQTGKRWRRWEESIRKDLKEWRLIRGNRLIELTYGLLESVLH